MLSVGFLPLAGCAAAGVADKAPPEVWEKLAGGEPQDLIVVFDDSAILAQAARMNDAKGIMFDDDGTLRFKAEHYAAIKQDAMIALPAGQVEILKDYAALPLMFLRFRSVAALQALLARPAVVRAYDDSKEHLMRQNSRP